MKITQTSRQEAGECADALKQLMRLGTGWGAVQMTFDDLDSRLQWRLRDLLTALEDAERGTPVKTEVSADG